jgi:hypothetical protein
MYGVELMHLLSEDAMRRLQRDVAIDLTDYLPDKSYDECLQLTKDLGLIEVVQHGPHDYGRLTQNGINVFNVLLRLLEYRTDPNNRLKKT